MADRTVDHKLALRIKRSERGNHEWLASPDDGTELFLFDLTADPFEMNNLAGTVGHEGRCEALRDVLLSWDRDTPWLEIEAG